MNAISLATAILVGIILGSLISIYREYKFNKRYLDQRQKWLDGSFEYQGVRFNKKYWKLVDGKIEHIESDKWTG